MTLTLYDVSQALGIQQVFEASHLLLQLTHQTVVGIFIDHSVAANLFGAIGIPESREDGTRLQSMIQQVVPTEENNTERGENGSADLLVH